MIARWTPTPESIDTSAGGGVPASTAFCSWTTQTSDVGSGRDSTSTPVASVKPGYIFLKLSSKKPPYVETLIFAPSMLCGDCDAALALLAAAGAGFLGAHAARIGSARPVPARTPPRLIRSRLVIGRSAPMDLPLS